MDCIELGLEAGGHAIQPNAAGEPQPTQDNQD